MPGNDNPNEKVSNVERTKVNLDVQSLYDDLSLLKGGNSAKITADLPHLEIIFDQDIAMLKKDGVDPNSALIKHLQTLDKDLHTGDKDTLQNDFVLTSQTLAQTDGHPHMIKDADGKITEVDLPNGCLKPNTDGTYTFTGNDGKQIVYKGADVDITTNDVTFFLSPDHTKFTTYKDDGSIIYQQNPANIFLYTPNGLAGDGTLFYTNKRVSMDDPYGTNGQASSDVVIKHLDGSTDYILNNSPFLRITPDGTMESPFVAPDGSTVWQPSGYDKKTDKDGNTIYSIGSQLEWKVLPNRTLEGYIGTNTDGSPQWVPLITAATNS